jgi:flagellar basal body-associated protein FliL
MKHTKFTTVLAAVVISFLSIYAATNTTFMSTNQTTSQQQLTLNMTSGAQLQQVLAPGQQIQTNFASDQVQSVTICNVIIPQGVNAYVQSPSGMLKVMWQTAGGASYGIVIDPSTMG